MSAQDSILYRDIDVLGVAGIPAGRWDVVVHQDGVNVFDHGSADSSFRSVRDGSGLVLSPGFIDMHSHSDLYRFKNDEQRDLPLGDIPKVGQGCTYQVLGQDGYSAAPVRIDDKDDYSQFISGLDGGLDPHEWMWSSFGEYVERNASVPGTRTAHLVGHSTLRRYVSGMAKRELRHDELIAMGDLLDDALTNGAVGLSTGLVYAPASFSNTAELLHLARVLARHDSVIFVHLRSESNKVLEAAEEVASVCVEAGCRLHISHIKTAGAHNWHLTPKLIELLDNWVQDKGLKLTADLHPYVAGSTMATVFLPGWFQTNDIGRTREMLKSRPEVLRARDQILNDLDSWDNWWQFSGGWSGIRFADCADKSLIGRPLDELIRTHVSQDVNGVEAFEWFFRKLADSDLQASIISFNNSEENIAPFLRLPYVSLCTDGLINPHGRPHPRTYGAFPRLLSRFVRDLQVIDLPTAVEIAAVRGRNVIGDTKINDFVVFSPELIRDTSTFDDPVNFADGIQGTFIAGKELHV